MLNNLIMSLIMATMNASIVTIILIIFKDKLIRMLGADISYYIWFIIILTWIATWLPTYNVRIYSHHSLIHQIFYSYSGVSQLTLNIIFVLWLTGVIISMSLLVYQHMRFIYSFCATASPPSKNEKKLLKNILNRCHATRLIERIYFSPIITSPQINNLLTMRIYLPSNFFSMYTKDEQQYVIQHEIVHYKRFDIYANVAFLIFNCINWFNPLFYYSFKQFRNAQEIACDAKVCQQLTVKQIKVYAQSLIKTVTNKATYFSMVNYLMTVSSQLKQRFIYLQTHIMIKRYPYKTNVLIVMLITIIIVQLRLLNYLTNTVSSKIKIFADTRYALTENKDRYMDNIQIHFPNNLILYTSNVVIQYTDNAKKKIEKCIFDGPGTMIVNNRMTSFKYGELNPSSMQFTGAIMNR